MRIKFKKTAVEDMRATERYIREQLNNPSAAAKLTRRVYDAIMLLEDNPFMGTELCSRYAVDTDIRFLVVAKQIVFYRVVGNEYVEVTRVLDGRQDYMALLFCNSFSLGILVSCGPRHVLLELDLDFQLRYFKV